MTEADGPDQVIYRIQKQQNRALAKNKRSLAQSREGAEFYYNFFVDIG